VSLSNYQGQLDLSQNRRLEKDLKGYLALFAKPWRPLRLNLNYANLIRSIQTVVADTHSDDRL